MKKLKAKSIFSRGDAENAEKIEYKKIMDLNLRFYLLHAGDAKKIKKKIMFQAFYSCFTPRSPRLRVKINLANVSYNPTPPIGAPHSGQAPFFILLLSTAKPYLAISRPLQNGQKVFSPP